MREIIKRIYFILRANFWHWYHTRQKKTKAKKYLSLREARQATTTLSCAQMEAQRAAALQREITRRYGLGGLSVEMQRSQDRDSVMVRMQMAQRRHTVEISREEYIKFRNNGDIAEYLGRAALQEFKARR